MKEQFIRSLDDSQVDLETVGGKGASLARLSVAGFPVPGGFHITTGAYRRFVSQNDLQTRIMEALEAVDISRPTSLETVSQAINGLFAAAPIPDAIANAVIHAYGALPGMNPAVAIRSSATAEDLPEASFAGQQETYLNVCGPEAVLEAVQKCWASLWTARAIGYRVRRNIQADQVALAVVVQLLVPAEAAGILFTANPLNGRRDQVLISASWGLGEAVVGGLVTPDNLVTEKKTGKVLNRETADKLIQTVRVNGGTQEQSVPESLRGVPVLSDAQAGELTILGAEIEAVYDIPMDIEWTLMDGEFAVVQARPITALPEPEAPAPVDWPMPDPKGRYMRGSIVELLPDPVSPIFETMGLKAINRGIGLMSVALFKIPDERLLDGLMMTINGYAYQQVSFTPRQWWVLLSRMVPQFGYLLREGLPYWQNTAHPHYTKTVTRWEAIDLPERSPAELMDGIKEILDAFGEHLGALMASTMGPTAGSEGLFTAVYQKLVQRDGDPQAPAFLMGFDNIPLKAEKNLYDLAMWCCQDEALARYLGSTPAGEITKMLALPESPGTIDASVWQSWQREFKSHLDRFGYAIYDMDFSKPLPMDEPAPILEMLKLFIAGEIQNPHQRQRELAGRREQAVASVLPRLKGLKLWAFSKALNWAQKQAPLREDGLAEIGLGYPVLRRMLKELGSRFVKAGSIHHPDDIFWLEGAEVDKLTSQLDNGAGLEDFSDRVMERKALWLGRKRVTPPSQLPLGKTRYMGFEMDAFLAGGSGGPEGNTLKGVPTSPGKVTGTARVLHGVEDFDQMQPGDILVAGITTPAWTPLFAMAAGVVTDIGGPLSHGSIVAREYGIPAVLGTHVGTRFIHNGQTITVDGSAGTVTIINGDAG